MFVHWQNLTVESLAGGEFTNTLAVKHYAKNLKLKAFRALKKQSLELQS